MNTNDENKSALKHDRAAPKALPVEKMAYNVNELCAATGLCRHTFYNLVKRGKLRRIPNIRHALFARAEVERFLRGE